MHVNDRKHLSWWRQAEISALESKIKVIQKLKFRIPEMSSQF